MELAFVICLIIIGLILVYIELFLLPGVFIVGILGGASMVIGVYLSYDFFGKTGGHITLSISVLALIISMILGYRQITSNKWTLNKTIDGKVKRVETGNISVGDKGVAFSAIKPTGKAVIGGERMEVYSLGEFIEKNIEIEVSKIEPNKIFVKPISTDQM